MSVLYPFPCETDASRGVEADVYAAGYVALHPYWRERPEADLSAVEIDVEAGGGFHLSCTALPWAETVGTGREAAELAGQWCARILDVGGSEVAGLVAFLTRVLDSGAGDASPRAALVPGTVDEAAAVPVKRRKPRVDEVRDKLRAACVARGILGTRDLPQRMRLKRLHSKMGEEG